MLKEFRKRVLWDVGTGVRKAGAMFEILGGNDVDGGNADAVVDMSRTGRRGEAAAVVVGNKRFACFSQAKTKLGFRGFEMLFT